MRRRRNSGSTPIIFFRRPAHQGQNFSDDGGPDDMRDTERNNQVRSCRTVTVECRGNHRGNRLPSFENIPTGIAHDARIVPLKVFPGGQFAKINEALQWVLDNRERILTEEGALISAVNMSLGVEGLNVKNDAGLPPVILAERDLIKQLARKTSPLLCRRETLTPPTAPINRECRYPGSSKEIHERLRGLRYESCSECSAVAPHLC